MKNQNYIAFIIIAFIIVLHLNAISQNDAIIENSTEYKEKLIEKNDDIISDDSIFIYTEKMPEFPGGKTALIKFIAENLVYPEITHNGCSILGTVFIRFEVTKTGEVGKIEVQKGIDPLFDKKAIKVIKLLPNFFPGTHDGKPVNVWYSIPIHFKLN